jgi:ribosomal protein S18 acetylase RimI-like enzyme
VNAEIYGPSLKTETALNEIRKNFLYFIKKDGVIVGTAAHRTEPNGTIYISNINIDPDYQRQGIARAAMQIILTEHQAAKRVELVTHPKNQNALRLYQSLGFTIESQRENYFGDLQPRVVLILAKNL